MGVSKRFHHNELERKRRDHIKDSFSLLRDVIPAVAGEKVLVKQSQLFKLHIQRLTLFHGQINEVGGWLLLTLCFCNETTNLFCVVSDFCVYVNRFHVRSFWTRHQILLKKWKSRISNMRYSVLIIVKCVSMSVTIDNSSRKNGVFWWLLMWVAVLINYYFFEFIVYIKQPVDKTWKL